MSEKNTSKKILVGLSGGVDSAVSAYLLKQQGHDVTAGFMINYLAPEGQVCPTRDDMRVAKEVAEYLDIPFFTFDYRKEYEKKVLKYMYEGYKKGITPNPDIMCNSEIKFKVFQDEALELGFDAVATGHYARITSLQLSPQRGEGELQFHLSSQERIERGVLREPERYKLLKGVDETKDQSYFLAGLSQEQLSKALFPIGHLQKSEVREIAQKIGLPNAERPDSQGICFVGKVDFKKFLQKKIPHSEGNVIDTQGNILGKHKGVFYYTVGQRKGIDIGGQSEPIFVIKKDILKNELVMGTSENQELYSDSLHISEIHFLGETRDFPYTCKAKIRYRQEDQDCEIIYNISHNSTTPIQLSPQRGKSEQQQGYQVTFTKSQRAIASGQIIAFYDGDELWGSGVIL